LKQARFQPINGSLIAAGQENYLNIIDVGSEQILHRLLGHTKQINSVVWNSTGEYLASASEDSVRIWDLRTPKESIQQFTVHGNYCCAYHPLQQNIIIIGSYQSTYLWDIEQGKMDSISSHGNLVSCIATSPATGLAATGSHDKTVKLYDCR